MGFYLFFIKCYVNYFLLYYLGNNNKKQRLCALNIDAMFFKYFQYGGYGIWMKIVLDKNGNYEYNICRY